METLELEATIREKTGGNNAKHYRQEGKIPAVLYDQLNSSVPLVILGKELIKLYHKSPLATNALIKLNYELNGKKIQKMVISSEFEHDPISDRITHVDFREVKSATNLKLTVPVVFKGVAPGVKLGGMLVKVCDHLMISCSADQIPEFITVDVSNLNLDQNFRVKDLPKDANIEILSNKDQILAQVQSGRGAKSEASDSSGAAPSSSPAAKPAGK